MLNWLNLYLSLTFLTAKAGFGVADFAVIVDRDDRYSFPPPFDPALVPGISRS